MSLPLCKQAASNLSTHSKILSLLVPSYVSMLKNICSKFLCWVDSTRDLRPLCMSYLHSHDYAVFVAAVAYWLPVEVVNSCITDLFMSARLWTSAEQLCHMNDCLDRPCDPKITRGTQQNYLQEDQVDHGDLHQGNQADRQDFHHGSPGELGEPGRPPPGKIGGLGDLHQGVQMDQGHLLLGQ